jgi:hypothetical protein
MILMTFTELFVRSLLELAPLDLPMSTKLNPKQRRPLPTLLPHQMRPSVLQLVQQHLKLHLR